MRVKGKYELEIHLLALVGPLLEPLHSDAGSAFTELHHQCRVLAGAGRAGACPWLWGSHGAQHCLCPTLCHNGPGDPPRGCGRGSASRLKIYMFLISCYRWKDHAKLLSPERAYLSFQAGTQLLGHIVSN